MNTTIVNTAQCNALCFLHANFAGSETRQEFRWLGRIQWNLPLEVAESLRGFRYARTPTLRLDRAVAGVVIVVKFERAHRALNSLDFSYCISGTDVCFGYRCIFRVPMYRDGVDSMYTDQRLKLSTMGM